MDDATADAVDLPTLAAVQIRVETAGVASAATHLAEAALTARRLSASAVTLAAGVADRTLVDALEVLGEVCGDALDVVGLDLDLLASAARAGAAVYEQVERAVVAAGRGGPER